MGFFAEIIASFTPQVLFGMIGGFIGGIYGTNKKGYDVKITLILLFTATLAGSAVAEILQRRFELTYLLPICFIAIPAGAFSGYLLIALDVISPAIAAKVAEKIGDEVVEKASK